MVKNRMTLRRIGLIVLNFIEVYVPTVVFIMLVIAFMLQIFFRYFLVPLTWPLEFTLIAFIWITLLGACFAQRDNSHVKFSMIYDNAKPRTKIWMRITGNILLFISFCIAFYPTYKYVNFMSFKKSNVLKIPMNIAFFPYIVFLIIIIGRIGYDIIIDFKKIYPGKGKK